jgi:hypothetical protein
MNVSDLIVGAMPILLPVIRSMHAHPSAERFPEGILLPPQGSAAQEGLGSRCHILSSGYDGRA